MVCWILQRCVNCSEICRLLASVLSRINIHVLSGYTSKEKVNLRSLRCFCSDFQQISLYRLFIEASLVVAPVAIMAASF